MSTMASTRYPLSLLAIEANERKIDTYSSIVDVDEGWVLVADPRSHFVIAGPRSATTVLLSAYRDCNCHCRIALVFRL